MSLARRKVRTGSHTFLIAIVITFIIIIIKVQSDHTQRGYPIYTIFILDTYLKKETRGESFCQPESDTTCKEWKQEDTSSHCDTKTFWNIPCEIISSQFPIPSSSSVIWTNPPPACRLIHATSKEPQVNPLLPSLLLSLQPQKPQPTSTRTNTLIIHESKKGYTRTKIFPTDCLVCPGMSGKGLDGLISVHRPKTF